MQKLNNKKIAVLLTDGFEEIEFTKPKEALEEAGANIEIIAPEKKIKAWDMKDWGSEYEATLLLDDAEPQNYDALMLPGGVMNPDKLRQNKKAVEFVRYFMEENKPVAAICHAPQMLIETGTINGRKLTSYPSLQTDLEHAGANWVNEEVVVDNRLVTSRSPRDLEAFNKKMIEEFGK